MEDFAGGGGLAPETSWRETGDDARPVPATTQPRGLDPQDWEQFRVLGHQALDWMIDHLRTLEDRPVWQKAPDDVRAEFRKALPTHGIGLESALNVFRENIQPYATGNTHPQFMGWVHGAGTPIGMVAEMLAAGLNANCGGRDHIGIEVERQVVQWARELFCFPDTASGLFVTGTSMANFLGLLIAKTQALGTTTRGCGLGAERAPLVAYTSEQAHGCISQAMELSGLGSRQLRKIPADERGEICLDQLEQEISRDIRAGARPFLVVGTAGSVNIGAIDDLSALARIAERHKLWFHVDGAFGALAMLAPQLKPRLRGIERADSIAFDFHKWAHVPYDAGFLLVRDGAAHRDTFANPVDYLQRAARGLAAGETWPCDLGPDLSRGFRALKTWFTFQALGAERLGAAISGCCEVARHLERRIQESPAFELAAPVGLNIVCFGARCCQDGELNRQLVEDLHESGVAAPSLTSLDGRAVIRAAIVNHRTDCCHIDRFVEALHDGLQRRLDASHRVGSRAGR